MENFAVGEIIWAKIRGYPWWPAMITGTVDENKERKYIVGFIGDNTHSVLQKQKLAKFQKEYKNYANTKKKILLESIRLAKEMIENKGKADEFEKMRRSMDEKVGANINNINPHTKEKNKPQDSDSEKDKDEEESEEEQKPLKKVLPKPKGKSLRANLMSNTSTANIQANTSNNLNTHPSADDITNAMQKDFSKHKRKRIEEKKENQSEVNDLMKRIINFLLFISKNIDNNFNWENNKDLILKVFDYLKDYKLNNPIDFLKKTSLGIMIKYINSKVDDKDIQECSNLVYKNFEDQVLDQLFKSNSTK